MVVAEGGRVALRRVEEVDVPGGGGGEGGELVHIVWVVQDIVRWVVCWVHVDLEIQNTNC